MMMEVMVGAMLGMEDCEGSDGWMGEGRHL